MHLVGFAIEISYDVRPYERKIPFTVGLLINTNTTLKIYSYTTPPVIKTPDLDWLLLYIT